MAYCHPFNFLLLFLIVVMNSFQMLFGRRSYHVYILWRQLVPDSQHACRRMINPQIHGLHFPRRIEFSAAAR